MELKFSPFDAHDVMVRRGGDIIQEYRVQGSFYHLQRQEMHICSKLLMNWRTIFVKYAIANSICLHDFLFQYTDFSLTKPGSLKGRLWLVYFSSNQF